MLQCRKWSHEAVSCPSKVPTLNKNGDKKKGESAVMAVDQDSEVTVETKIDENDGGDTTCFIDLQIEKDVPSVGELPPETTVERWVADSGCSQFMTPSADIWLTTVRVEVSLELLTAVRCRSKALGIYQ